MAFLVRVWTTDLFSFLKIARRCFCLSVVEIEDVVIVEVGLNTHTMKLMTNSGKYCVTCR